MVSRIIVYRADGTGEGFLAGVNPLVKVVLSLEEERERERESG